MATIRITDAEASGDVQAAIHKAMAAKKRGDIVEVPWWFYPHAMSHPKFWKGDPKTEAANARIQEATR